MKLNVLGKQGEFCNEASVPIITGREKVIGFRELEYTIYRKGLLKKVVLPTAKGWVYLTDHRILMLNDGWDTQDKLARIVWVDVVADGKEYTIAYVPYGAAARLFSWLLKEKGNIEKYKAGELESPYGTDRFYRHPPK